MSSKVSTREMGASAQTMGFGTWFALYFGGAFLIVFLLAHLWAVHTASAGGSFTFGSVAARLRSPFFFFLDLGLLLLATYHGLAGVRRVIIDLGVLGPQGQRHLLWPLLAMGVVLVVVGAQVILIFARG